MLCGDQQDQRSGPLSLSPGDQGVARGGVRPTGDALDGAGVLAQGIHRNRLLWPIEKNSRLKNRGGNLNCSQC